MKVPVVSGAQTIKVKVQVVSGLLTNKVKVQVVSGELHLRTNELLLPITPFIKNIKKVSQKDKSWPAFFWETILSKDSSKLSLHFYGLEIISAAITGKKDEARVLLID